jgi:hypothetical protein
VVFAFGPEMKERRECNSFRETTSTSFIMLKMVVVSWSPLEVEKLALFCIPFKALRIALFTVFLRVKYFLISVARPNS